MRNFVVSFFDNLFIKEPLKSERERKACDKDNDDTEG